MRDGGGPECLPLALRSRGFMARLSGSEVTAEIGGRGVGGALEAEGRNEASVLVNQIDDGRVIHVVAALIERNLLEVDAVGLCDRRDGGGIAGEAHEM